MTTRAPAVLINQDLYKGGEDLMRGHGTIRVFFPHGTPQVFDIADKCPFASICCLHCGLQLRRGSQKVKTAKWTQIQVVRVAASEGNGK